MVLSPQLRRRLWADSAPVFAVFPENVRGGKVVGLLDSTLLVVGDEELVFRRVEEGERVVFLGEVFKVEFSAVERRYGGRGRHPHHPVRPEKISVRIYKPPFSADFFRSEMSRGLALSAGRPAAEPVAVDGAGVFGEFFPLFFGGGFEFRVGMDFPRPFPEFELPVFVHKREEFPFGHIEPCGNVGGVVLGGGQRIELHWRAVPVPGADKFYFFYFRVVGGEGGSVASAERARAHSADFRRRLGIPWRPRVFVDDGFSFARGDFDDADLQKVRCFGIAVGNLELQFQDVRL